MTAQFSVCSSDRLERAIELERYVLVTPARNEERTIAQTLQSVASQTRLPEEWVIVDDGSTDQTCEIIESFVHRAPYLRLVRTSVTGPRDFASAVRATEKGYASLQTTEYEFIGLLDADVRFQPDYFKDLIVGLRSSPELGLTGGLVEDIDARNARGSMQNMREVAGAVQFFRRQCFESLGGLCAIPEGGWDAITCARVRMNGYRTETRSDLVVEHLKLRNAAFGSVFRRHWQLGLRDYVLGASPIFESFKCLVRLKEPPLFVSGGCRMLGYLQAALTRRERRIPPDVAKFIRVEQYHRLLKLALPFYKGGFSKDGKVG